MTTALPIDRPWYRQLLAVAVPMGLVIGLLGLVYLGVTGALTDRSSVTPGSTPGPVTGGGSRSSPPAGGAAALRGWWTSPTTCLAVSP